MIARYQEEGQLKKEHPLYSIAVLLGQLMYMAILDKTITDIELPPVHLTTHVERFLEGRQIRTS